MKLKKQNNKEIMIQFKQTHNPKELDEMLLNFEKNMNKLHRTYFLKETENPFIYLLEYAKPEELIKEMAINEEFELIPVTCVISNINYITSTILRKIRHKICYQDTFDVNCYMDSYTTITTKENLEEELSSRLENLMHIEKSSFKPVWTIEVHIVGDITGINIISKKQNRTSYNMWT